MKDSNSRHYIIVFQVRNIIKNFYSLNFYVYFSKLSVPYDLKVKDHGLYHLTVQAPLRETIHEPKLDFKGHCISMLTDSNSFVIYLVQDKVIFSTGHGRTTYRHQILFQILPSEKMLEANKIKKMVVNKSKWSQLFFVS